MSGFLDDIIHREINENKSSARNPVYPWIEEEVGRYEVGLFLVALGIIGLIALARARR